MKLIFKVLYSLTLIIGVHAGAAAEEAWPDTLVIGTAGRGGTYDAYGQGLANVINKRLGIPSATRETSGPDENIELLARDQIQVGFVTLGAALNSLRSSKPRTSSGIEDMRAIAPMYDTAFHFVVRQQSLIHDVMELSNKTIGVGPAGGTTDNYVPRMLAGLGLTATYKTGDWGVLGDELAAGTIDLLAAAGGTPFPALLELNQKTSLRFVHIRTDEVIKLDLSIPELTPSVIPVGLYPWETRPYSTVGMFNFMVVRKTLPYTLVVALLDSIFSGNDQLISYSPAAAETIPKNIDRNNIVPFHAGAVQWYEHHTQGQGRSD